MGDMRPPHQADPDLPKLTDQQKDQVRKIRLDLAERTLPLRNGLSEKESHLRTLTTAGEPDRTAIDKAADEIGNMRKELFKARIVSDLKIDEVSCYFPLYSSNVSHSSRPGYFAHTDTVPG